MAEYTFDFTSVTQGFDSKTVRLALYALLGASIIMLAYLAVAWRRLPKTNRRNIGLNIVVWLFLAYAVIHANGLTLSVMFGS